MKTVEYEDLEKLFGIKKGDIIKTDCIGNNVLMLYCGEGIFKYKRSNGADLEEFVITSLVGEKFDIVKRFRKLGETKCKEFTNCNGCVLELFDCEADEEDTLFEIADEIFDNVKKTTYTIELSNIVFKELDKEVEDKA